MFKSVPVGVAHDFSQVYMTQWDVCQFFECLDCKGVMNLGEQFGYFSQVILELVTNFRCQWVHVVRVPVPAVLLAVHPQVASQQHLTQLQLAISSV